MELQVYRYVLSNVLNVLRRCRIQRYGLSNNNKPKRSKTLTVIDPP